MDRKKNILDKIGSLIPGYRGYQERDGQRTCDKQLRLTVSESLNSSEKLLISIMNKFINNKDYKQLKQLENIRKEMNTLNSKIKYSSYGVSSFFSDSQIKDSELSELYNLDLRLLENSNQIKKYIVNEDLDESQIIIENMQNSLTERNNFLIKFK